MNELTKFQNDSKQRDEVKNFMISTLKDMVVQKVMAGESVVGMKEAFDLVTALFNKLDQEHGK